jgi:hypothetical protein
MNKVNKKNEGNKNYMKNKFEKKKDFGLNKFDGKVLYDVEGLMEKKRE